MFLMGWWLRVVREAGSKDEAAFGVEHHGEEQQRQVDDGNSEELTGEDAVFRVVGGAGDAQETDGCGEIAGVENDGGYGVWQFR